MFVANEQTALGMPRNLGVGQIHVLIRHEFHKECTMQTDRKLRQNLQILGAAGPDHGILTKEGAGVGKFQNRDGSRIQAGPPEGLQCERLEGRNAVPARHQKGFRPGEVE
jgi:hypothetical protein